MLRECSSVHITVLICQSALCTSSLDELTDVIRSDYLSFRLFIFAIILEHFTVDKSTVAMHEPILPLSVVYVACIVLHDASAIIQKCFRLKLAQVFSFVALNLAVDEISIFKAACKVLTCGLNLEHAVALPFTLKEIAAISVPVCVIVKTVPVVQVVDEIARILIPIGFVEDTLAHRVCFELT